VCGGLQMSQQPRGAWWRPGTRTPRWWCPGSRPGTPRTWWATTSRPAWWAATPGSPATTSRSRAPGKLQKQACCQSLQVPHLVFPLSPASCWFLTWSSLSLQDPVSSSPGLPSLSRILLVPHLVFPLSPGSSLFLTWFSLSLQDLAGSSPGFPSLSRILLVPHLVFPLSPGSCWFLTWSSLCLQVRVPWAGDRGDLRVQGPSGERRRHQPVLTGVRACSGQGCYWWVTVKAPPSFLFCSNHSPRCLRIHLVIIKCIFYH